MCVRTHGQHQAFQQDPTEAGQREKVTERMERGREMEKDRNKSEGDNTQERNVQRGVEPPRAKRKESQE